MASDLVLYSDPFFVSPYVFSSFVALTEKQLPFELATMDLTGGRHRGSAWEAQSITGRVPSLRHGDFWLAESSAIAEYLEELAPDRARVLPVDRQERARARQVMAFLRSDLGALRDERSAETVFYPSTEARAPLSAAGQAARGKLIRVAEQLLEGRETLFGSWCLADTELAMMLQRLVQNHDPVPAPLAAFAERQWQRPSARGFIEKPRAPFAPYNY
jgi:glutathione S-transferase